MKNMKNGGQFCTMNSDRIPGRNTSRFSARNNSTNVIMLLFGKSMVDVKIKSHIRVLLSKSRCFFSEHPDWKRILFTFELWVRADNPTPFTTSGTVRSPFFRHNYHHLNFIVHNLLHILQEVSSLELQFLISNMTISWLLTEHWLVKNKTQLCLQCSQISGFSENLDVKHSFLVYFIRIWLD